MIHQCPKCELRFDRKTEVDDHCWHDHPEFRHEYPAQAAPPSVTRPVPQARPEPEAAARINLVDGVLGWLVPPHRAERRPGEHQPSGPESEHSHG
ncbi:MAG: hypothetical protein ABI140_18300 [Jatrophihabitantaceae bacterium]